MAHLVCNSARSFTVRGIFNQTISTSWRRWSNTRALTLTPETMAKPQEETPAVNNEPIKFSTSKGSHKVWRVDRTMGSQFQRPWWKVLSVSVIAAGFLIWCIIREETEVDVMLEQDLYDHLPGLLPEAEGEPPQEK